MHQESLWRIVTSEEYIRCRRMIYFSLSNLLYYLNFYYVLYNNY